MNKLNYVINVSEKNISYDNEEGGRDQKEIRNGIGDIEKVTVVWRVSFSELAQIYLQIFSRRLEILKIGHRTGQD